MNQTTERIDMHRIAPALAEAYQSLHELTLAGAAMPGSTKEIMLRHMERSPESPLRDAFKAYVDAGKALYALAQQRAQESENKAQSLAMAFMTQETGQQLPGVLSLSNERGCAESITVMSVSSFHVKKEGGWSAILRVETSPCCYTTRTIRLNAHGKVEWESELDF